MFTLIKDAVRKTYKELQKGREDFTGFLTDARLVTLFFYEIKCDGIFPAW